MKEISRKLLVVAADIFAIRAAWLGVDTVIVETRKPGGSSSNEYSFALCHMLVVPVGNETHAFPDANASPA